MKKRKSKVTLTNFTSIIPDIIDLIILTPDTAALCKSKSHFNNQLN